MDVSKATTLLFMRTTCRNTQIGGEIHGWQLIMFPYTTYHRTTIQSTWRRPMEAKSTSSTGIPTTAAGICITIWLPNCEHRGKPTGEVNNTALLHQTDSSVCLKLLKKNDNFIKGQIFSLSRYSILPLQVCKYKGSNTGQERFCPLSRCSVGRLGKFQCLDL